MIRFLPYPTAYPDTHTFFPSYPSYGRIRDCLLASQIFPFPSLFKQEPEELKKQKPVLKYAFFIWWHNSIIRVQSEVMKLMESA